MSVFFWFCVGHLLTLLPIDRPHEPTHSAPPCSQTQENYLWIF